MNALVQCFIKLMPSVTLFVCPIVIYILLFKQPARKKIHGHYSVPGWNILLKRLWAYFVFFKFRGHVYGVPVKKHWKPIPDDEEEELEGDHKLTDKNSIDSMYICGTDNKGSSLYLKIVKRRQHIADVWLHVRFKNGITYQLIDHPNTVVFNVSTKTWNAQGLKLYLLEPFKRWRITFNGLLKKSYHQTEGNTEDTSQHIDHIVFNFIWTACSRRVDCHNMCTPGLLSESLAREPWRDADWKNVLQVLGSGYDQYGVFRGIWKESNGDEKELYLRGLRQRRWDLDQASLLHRGITFAGFDTNGLMFTVSAVSSFYGPTHLVYGHIEEMGGVQLLIDQCDLSLPDLAESKIIPKVVVIRFKAGGKNYTLAINFVENSSAELYGGWPWNYETHTRIFQCTINSNEGSGTANFFYRYKGECPVASPSTIILEPKVLEHHRLVTTFKDKECQSVAIVGGKGASLAQLSTLQSDKWKVPSGFCLTMAALGEQLKYFQQLQKAITQVNDVSCNKKQGDLKKYCERTVFLFENTPVCESVTTVLLDTLKSEKLAGPWAVRSSAIGEDSEELSAAGQNITVLGVADKEALLVAVRKCWGSLYAFQSVQYRRQNGQPVQCGMGVVIQTMIPAESAGVLFTRHPLTGDARQLLITSNFGLGESVVSASVDPDTVILERSKNDDLTIKQIIFGKKEHKVCISDNGGVKTELLVSMEMSQVSITKEQALSLGYVGLAVEKAFGHARDIEWAIINDNIYLLQARPITSLDTWTDYELLHELDTPYVFDHEITSTANLGEVLPGATSPLCLSVILPVINFTGEGSVTGKLTNNLYMVHISHNHALLNMLSSTLSSPDKKLSIFNKVSEIAVFGHAVITPEMHRIAIDRNGITTPRKKINQLYNFIKMAYRNKRNVQSAEMHAETFNVSFTDYVKASACYEKITESLSIFEKIGTYHSQSSGTSVFSEIILFTLLLEGKEDLSLEHYNDISLLLSSCNDIISAEVPLALKDIARSICKSDRSEEFCILPPEIALEWLQINCTEASYKLTEFLSRHGHRGYKEFDFMTETWSIDPKKVVATLQAFVKAPQPDESQPKQVMSVQDTINQLISPQKSVTRFLLKCLLPICRTSVRRREITKATYIKFVHFFRLAYRHLSKLMVEEGFLPDCKLIFFLTHYEIGQVLKSRDPVLVKKAARRCKLWPQWDKFQFSEIMIGLPAPISESFEHDVETSERVCGTPVYPGTVVGRACVIFSLDEISQLQQGDILITYSTDIGWSPYFPILGGVVTEIGGLISHGAVVAREYGLPCIVGAQSATTVFKTGDTVLLIGSNGTIDKIKKEEVSLNK